MQAKDVMTTRVITVSPDTSIQSIARLLMDERISAVPVVDERSRVVGIVSEGDLMRRSESGTERRGSPWLSLLATPAEAARAYAKSHGRRAGDVMTRDIISVKENASLADVAALLERHHIKRVPVLRDGALVGIISRANLLQGLVAQASGQPGSADDLDIRARIQAELRDAGLDALRMNIVVSRGSVSLWGIVDSEDERRAIRIVAENTAGVTGVEDHLNVMSAMLRGTWPA